MISPRVKQITARRLETSEKVQPGDWYLIPWGSTFFQVREEMVGKSWIENNAEWFRFLGFYRI